VALDPVPVDTDVPPPPPVLLDQWRADIQPVPLEPPSGWD
jgi:hypothetical protein